MRRFFLIWLVSFLLLFGVGVSVLLLVQGNQHSPAADGKPRLAVLIVFDQMRADYLTKWQKHFDKAGFGRVLEEGAWFQNCHYPYANTMTAAGHASMATGCSPNKHGVVANSWYDRDLAMIVNAVHTERYPLVPLLGKKKRGAAPTRRLKPGIADELLKQHKGKAKVVSISIKDRAAIMLAALLRCLVLWFDRNSGAWVTSTYYADALPRWVSKYNKSKGADQWFGKSWTRLRGDVDYNALAGPDDFKSEGVGYSQGRTFPHKTTGGAGAPGINYYNALINSRFGNDMTLDLAKRAIVEEKLGQDDIPDLLCVSFSSNDYVGHCWGPNSQEALDITLRSDRHMKELLHFLDSKVGKGRYLVVVCSDHGVCPLPEWTRGKSHKKAGRFPSSLLNGKANAFLNDKFGNGKSYRWIEAVSSGMIYLNRGVLNERKIEQRKVEAALAAWLTGQTGIKAAYTRSQLTNGKSKKDDRYGQMVQRSFYPKNSGDVMVVLTPYYLPGSPSAVYTTTHGSPHSYDTHVPLLIFGANVRPGIRRERTTPQAIAAILAEGIGIEPPPACKEKAPAHLWKK